MKDQDWDDYTTSIKAGVQDPTFPGNKETWDF